MSTTQHQPSPGSPLQRVRSPKQWYVLFHFKPSELEQLLRLENARRQRRHLRLFEYFMPGQFLPEAEPDPYARNLEEQRALAATVNEMRDVLRTYVFIRASSREIQRLLNQSWNRDARLQLRFRNNHDGTHIVMPDASMQQFITVCCEHRQYFTFGPPIVDISLHETVVIRTGPFQDTEARVLDIQQTDSGLSLTLGIPFFCGEQTLLLGDYTPDDLHLPLSVGSLLNNQFVDNVCQQVLSVLYRRMKSLSAPFRSSDDPSDQTLLNQVSHYGYVRMTHVPSHVRFRCMLALCAVLRFDADARLSLVTELQALLADDARLSEADRALIQATLYVCTADASCRTAAKTWWQSHKDDSDTLSRLMPLVTRLNRRFFKQHHISTHG